MNITKELYYQILSHIPICPPECGGIIAGKNNIVSHFCIDEQGIASANEYMPNIKYINETIELWRKNNIDFLGIFHTHPESGRVLSKSDITYITKIMTNISDENIHLYFPIIIPRKEIISYYSQIVNGDIQILNDEINFV